jgi:nucleotide-binding universal stress UspA family protein
MSTIVVGIDGSEGSKRALEFALEQARAGDDEVRAVNAWHIPAVVYEGAVGGALVDTGEFERGAQAELDRVLRECATESSGVTVTPVLRHGQPAESLCEEAEQAKLLVVGSRGLGGFRGLLLGSVSQQCAQHARCPVVIIPKDGEKSA